MRKYFATVSILAVFYLTSFSQTDEMVHRHADSLKKVLPNEKGNAEIDCLNVLAADYIWLDDGPDKLFDTACIFANQAYNKAKTSNYKRGLGYAYLYMGWGHGQRVDDDKTNNNTEANYIQAIKYAKQAIEIGEEINDYNMAGDVYNFLKWMERWKGDADKYKNDLQKAIYYYEKPKKLQKDIYNEVSFASCAGCSGNEKLLGDLYGQLAVITNGEKNKVAAEEQLNKAIHYYNVTGNKSQLGYLYRQLAQVYFLNYDYRSSEQTYLQAKEYFHEAGEVEDEIGMLNEVSKIYEVRGDFENGITAFKNSIKLIEEYFKNKPSGSLKKRSAGQAFFWMARLYMIAGDYEEALSIIHQGRQYYSARRDTAFIEPWMSAIGDAHRLMGNYDSAMYYLKYFQNTDNDPNNFGKICLGYLYLDMKDYSKALSLILPYYQHLKTINRITPPIVNALIIASNAFLGEKKYNQALQYAKEAQAYINQMDGRVLKIDNYKLLSDIYYQLNAADSAYTYLKKYTTLKDSLINRQFYFKLNNLKNESEEQKKTSQINLLNKNNQLKEQKLKQQAIIRNSLVGGLMLLLLLALFVFRNLSLKRKKERAELQKRATELEMQALRAQMNPHFIFNCLSSINKFILKNESRVASDYLTRFSRLVRMVLTNSQLSMIPLSDEIEMLRLYLDMERLRFDNAFDYHIVYENTIEPETIYIPPMLLQPFCENAIWHGLMPKQDQGQLDIMMNTHNSQLQCIIKDNGIGRAQASDLESKDGEKKKSFGLKITTERLALFNNEKMGGSFYLVEDVLDAERNVAGTKVTLNVKYKDTIHELVNV